MQHSKRNLLIAASAALLGAATVVRAHGDKPHASKGAVKMLTKGMAIDLGPHGINVNGIGPGYFKTELTAPLVADPTFSAWLMNHTPSRRWGEVEDLGPAAVFLCSDAGRFVNGHIMWDWDKRSVPALEQARYNWEEQMFNGTYDSDVDFLLKATTVWLSELHAHEAELVAAEGQAKFDQRVAETEQVRKTAESLQNEGKATKMPGLGN